MEVKHHLVAVQMQIYGAGLRRDAIWMDRIHEYRSLDWGDTQISGNEWCWDGTWIELSCISWAGGVGMGAEVQFSWPEWRRHATWIEVRHKSLDLVGDGTLHGWRWDSNLTTWMEVIQYIDEGLTRIWGLGCRRGRHWVDGRHTFWDLHVFVNGPE